MVQVGTSGYWRNMHTLSDSVSQVMLYEGKETFKSKAPEDKNGT